MAAVAGPVESLDLETHGYQLQGTRFQVEKRYKILETMRHGAHGMVCLAEDQEMEERVRIKKVEHLYEHLATTKRTLRELRILRHLQHENLMEVKRIFFTGKKDDFQEIYVVSDLMETDLGSTLKSSQDLSDDHVQFFLYQILRGMKYVHSAQVIHRDLKPRSLLVNSSCDLKICDFGLARMRFSDSEWVCPMTEYVCTRWYRAPEVLCSWADYSGAIDIWSIGCILLEMYIRKPIFPGTTTQEQLDLIIGVLGSPESSELSKIPNEKCRKFIRGLPKTEGQPFQQVVPSLSPEALDLLSKMMRWDPESRLTVYEAIEQPYLEKWHCPDDEPVCSPLDTSAFEFERRKINLGVLREEIFREVLCYFPEHQARFNQAQLAGGSRYDIGSYRILQPGESQYSDDSSDEDGGDD